MGYPVGPLLRAMAERILYNLDFIEKNAPHPDGPDFEQPPFADTQLLISLLGVLVFPHERTPGALGELVRGYPGINDIVEVRHSAAGAHRVEIEDEQGRSRVVDASSLEELPRLLRNSIAHFNILPINEEGRFAGVRVWNTNDDGLITFVADITFRRLRPFAQHMLKAIAESRGDLTLDDPPDPLEVLSYQEAPERRRRAPRIVDHVWERLLSGHGGDRDAAQRTISRVLAREARSLGERSVQPR